MATKKRISIKDIAKAAGTSITTVSFILNGKAKERRISDAVNKRVLDYVRRMGYKPSQFVRNGAANQTKVLALLVDDIHHPFFSEVGEHMERVASERGYQVVYSNTGTKTEKIDQLVKLWMDKEVDGICMVPSEDLSEALSKIKKQHVPTVFVDSFIPDVNIPYVVSDHRKGAYDATVHLLATGSKRVGLISLYSNRVQMRARQDGYMDAMDESQKQSFIRKLNIEDPDNTIGEEIVAFIVENKLEAVLFADHYLAIHGLKAIKEQAIEIPRIVAFDDHVLFALHTPAISVVTQDTAQIAGAVMDMLTARIDGKVSENSGLIVPYVLIARESSIS